MACAPKTLRTRPNSASCRNAYEIVVVVVVRRHNMRAQVASLVEGRILVGHSLENDLRVRVVLPRCSDVNRLIAARRCCSFAIRAT